MENCRPVEAGIPNLLPALKGKPNLVKFFITLDEDVNVSALEEAINRTVKTFPFIGKKIEGRDGVYYYADNPLPFVISEGLQEVNPFLPEGNFHSITFSYEKNKLCILIDHILFDGTGMKNVLEIIFYHYFCIVDNKIYDVPKGVFVENVEGLTDEPFTKKFETDDSPIFDNNSSTTDFFRFPELDISQDLLKATELITVSADSAEFMRYVKSVGGTPLSAMASLFFTIFQKAHPENDKTLKNLTSVSVRGITETPDTILNAAYILSYYSTPENALKVDAESERAKNIELRNILKRYKEPENMKKIANNLHDLNKQFQNWLKAPQTVAMPKIPVDIVSFYIVYFGTFHSGEYVKHFKRMQFFSSINPVYSCMIMELGNKFFINLRQPFHSDIYKNGLIDELQKRGVTSARLEIER